VQQAIDAKIERSDRLRRRIYDSMAHDVIKIDTSGSAVGQVNGLSVIDLGEFAFGQPSRITATTRLGNGKIVDIERETDLGGPLHSKGVLILSNFLASRYATEKPLSLSASVVFEQSYGMVDGDSASLAELCTLLSALADAPIQQGIAVTGSVNQLGIVQAIGGVNEKIEGFFDVCNQKPLTGEQGVIIPDSNLRHLMLRADVVQACKEGRFHVHAVQDVDQAIQILTGLPAGEADTEGKYPAGSVNARVEQRLVTLADIRVRLGKNEHNESVQDNSESHD
jgi:predicted ATP-dependent protease